MDPRAKVDLAVLGPPTVPLHRADPVQVELAGMQPGWRYTVPDSGPGGTILFAADPVTRLPTAAYRFELRIPALAGPRYVYACVGS
jgi:hypothetical protein